MLVTDFSTDSVAVHDRFARFEATADSWYLPNHFRSDRADDFRARMRGLFLGDLTLSVLTCSHLEVTRTPKLIRQQDPEVYQFHYVPHGLGVLSQAGREARLRGGRLVITDSSTPYHGWIKGEHALPCSIVVHVPRRILPLPRRAVQRVLAVPLPVDQGVGALYARWLADLNARAHEFTPAEAPSLADATTGLLSSLLSRVLDTGRPPSPEARKGALWIEIRDFIHRHLDDPSLTPAAVATAHGVSVRHLHDLFAAQSTTPAGWIRHRRLERCRHDLADPGLAGRPIQTIGARWGFPDPAHFSRTFRTAYGMGPRDYRHMALREAPMRKQSTGVQGNPWAS
ncbi:helix-turn-helix domain-containing protein [Streptomyces sp. NPDC004609]|uniref:AraC-like ligand-binding domain-containing protein n=1 Tax=Streptomyces sp. NPDC004609 TaxID=3364704 RepID=UPI00368C726B